MKTNFFLVVVLAVAVGCALAVMFFDRHPAAEKSAPQIAGRPSSPAPVQDAPAPVSPPAANSPAPGPDVSVSPAKIDRPQNPQIQRSGNAVNPKEPIHDPDARAALSFVGVDPAAESYWMSAINDPNLPANERKDLIEDLNEDGLSDPKHPGPEDMPLIANRLALLENLDPMDQVNADAMQEAYKDLTALLAGKPAH